MALFSTVKRRQELIGDAALNWDNHDYVSTSRQSAPLKSILVGSSSSANTYVPVKYLTLSVPDPVPASAQLYQPQTSIPVYASTCYICKKAVTDHLQAVFQFSGCTKNHRRKFFSNTELSIIHFECYGTYVNNARGGGIQCAHCDLESNHQQK